MCAVYSDGARTPISETKVRVMTTCTGQCVVAGKERVEEQVTAQIDLLRRKPVAGFGQSRLWASDTGVTQRIVVLIQRAQLAAIGVAQLKSGWAIVTQGDVRVCVRHREQRNSNES